ncbi:hypothetical protein Y1Q_0006970 [Alligator mississippiensis]|uniref:Reverse transcriptase domain-containing protein n=1 Tax=Alligator mississippiensis TaxID=8496 RepID=A0A151PBR4_ALLMI|nr:hypothetical protein Y1Q_0006970 [Alligator mississippiensis]
MRNHQDSGRGRREALFVIQREVGTSGLQMTTAICPCCCYSCVDHSDQNSRKSAVGSPGGLDLYGQNLSFLAYADDLVLLASDTTQLQQMLDATSEAARWMGLCFNVTKCASLHIDGRQKSRVLDSTLMIQG